MSLFGRIRSAGSKVWNCLAKSATKVVSSACEAGSKVWYAITGKGTFLEAQALYDSIVARFDLAKRSYEHSVTELTESIDKNIQSINLNKKEIYRCYFQNFVRVGNRLHNVIINGHHFEDYFKDDIFFLQGDLSVREKKDVFLIDFNKLKISEVFKSIITLGFYSRKAAKESLYQVKDEEVRVEEEILKMKAQISKLQVIDRSIAQVCLYFDRLIANYESLLRRFEFGVNTQIVAMCSIGRFERLDFRLMPLAHIEEFHALFNMTIILKRMSDLSYLSNDCDLVEADLIKFNKYCDLSQQLLAA